MIAHRERLIAMFHTAPLAGTTGMRLHYESGGSDPEGATAVLEMPYDERFDHSCEDMHGGLVATMIDNAGFFAAAQHYDTWIVTVEFVTRLLAPVGRQSLRASGRVVRHGGRMATAEMRVHNASGTLIAVGSGTFAATRRPLPAPPSLPSVPAP